MFYLRVQSNRQNQEAEVLYLRKIFSDMTITTEMLDDELYKASTADGRTVTIDMRSEKKDQNPVELLLSSLSACGAVDIVEMLKKRKKTIRKFTIETSGVRRETPPRSFTKIHCTYVITSPDVNEEELYKFAKLSLEKYCSVAASLKSQIDFSVRVIRS
jgi:putative redox protein